MAHRSPLRCDVETTDFIPGKGFLHFKNHIRKEAKNTLMLSAHDSVSSKVKARKELLTDLITNTLAKSMS